MGPEDGNIFIAHDNPDILFLIKINFKLNGFDESHLVVATNPEEAEKLVPELGDRKTRAAIIDAGLGARPRAEDGTAVNANIKRLYGDDIITYGISQEYKIPGADFPKVKWDEAIKKILELEVEPIDQ